MSENEEIPPGDNGEELQVRSAVRRLESSYYSVVGRTMTDGRVMIGQDIEIFPGKECKELASPGTKAYEAKDRRATNDLFALLCGRGTVPRVTNIGSYKELKNQNVVRLVTAGVVDWGPENRQRFALIFEKPFGRKILESPDAKPYRIVEDKLIQSVIAPAVLALADFRNIDLIHGAINAENMYLAGGEGLERIILGECLSSAPSMRQHPLYEMASRATAQPSGRGPGTVKDDLYALGVCVAMIARGENVLTGKTPQQIIREKIAHGSYALVAGRDRIPGGISEFLRGVLNDDDLQRWDIDDALRWLEGRRLSPKQPGVALQATRPLIFADQQFWDLKSVANAFAENIPEAALEIEKDQFELWLKRNFDDKALRARLEALWEKEKSASRERLVCAVCMAIDPFGAIRYKKAAIFPGGLGTALAEAMASGTDIQVYAEMLSQQLIVGWVNQIYEEYVDAAGTVALLEKCRSALSQKMPGYGIERVLYMLNPEAVCMSPLLKDYFVLVPGTLLLALEGISRHGDRPKAVLDRHMIAFISVREPKMIDMYLGYVNSNHPGTQMVGVIRTLAAIQRRFAVGPVPGVCNWLISLTPPVIELLNDHDLRQELSKRVTRLQDTGNLGALLDLIDDPTLIQEDKQRFALARYEYKMLGIEKGEIETHIKMRKHFGKATGRQVAMIISTVLSTLFIVGYVLLRMTKMM